MENNIVITGGELFNKGAQSMTFTVVDELKKRFPEKEIYLFSGGDYKRDKSEKRQYNFNILPLGPWICLRKLYPFFKPFIKNKHYSNEVERELTEVIKNTKFVVDISGYNLSSQFGAKSSYSYLLRVKLFKKYDVPIYIFPQSIGPFDYKFPYKVVLDRMISSTLSYPEIILPRENHGYELLKKHGLNNVEKNVDTVFYQDELELANIYNDIPKLNVPEIKENSVAIVPNSKVLRHNFGNDIDEIYEAILEYLIDRNKNIYTFRHSFEDMDFCRRIYNLAKDYNKINLLKDDFSAIELYKLLDKFDYIVGSRYHSVVHSYKNQTPALIIGWAVKYKELSKMFDQENYCFDIRENLNIDEIINKLNVLNNNYENDSETISAKIKDIKRDNIFDKLE